MSTFLKPVRSCSTCVFFKSERHPDFKIVVVGDTPKLLSCTVRNVLLRDTLLDPHGIQPEFVVCDEHREWVA